MYVFLIYIQIKHTHFVQTGEICFDVTQFFKENT